MNFLSGYSHRMMPYYHKMYLNMHKILIFKSLMMVHRLIMRAGFIPSKKCFNVPCLVNNPVSYFINYRVIPAS